MIAPALLVAVGILLALLVLRPPGWVVLALIVLVFVPGRWWRWRTRRFRRGLRALRRGDTAAARSELTGFLAELAEDPNFDRIQPYFNLGRPYPYAAAAHANLGVAALREGATGEALASFRDSLALDPEWVPARYGLAAALRLEGDIGGAERQARRALAARPNHLATRLLLALSLRDQGRHDEAGTLLASIAEEGRDPEALLLRLEDEWGET